MVPHELIARIERDVFFRAVEPTMHIQAALAEFMAQGHFTRHIGHMRKLYARRLQVLADALGQSFRDKLNVEMPAGGMQLIVHLPVSLLSPDAIHRAANTRVFLGGLHKNFFQKTTDLNAVHIGFAAVPEDKIGLNVTRLVQALGEVL